MEKKGEYTVRRVGRPYTANYRVYFERSADGIPVSPFHDIPLYHDQKKGVLNMVVEIPRWTNAKFEISRDKHLNPIYHDTLDSAPRFVKSCFPYKGYIWNYGALPQTWEDPHHTDPATSHRGDNDPLDACLLSRAIVPSGSVCRVRPLGILALLDEDETDWKVMVVDVEDPLASELHDIDDVERLFPGLLDATRDWFRIYKIPDGAEANRYALDGEFQGKEYAEKIITECAEAWKRLVTGGVEAGDISLANTTLEGTAGKLDPRDVHLPPGEDLPPAPISQDVEEWFFVDREALHRKEASLAQSQLKIALDIQR